MVCDIYGNHVAARPPAVYGIRTSDTCPGNAAPARYTRAHPPGGMAIWTVPTRRARNGEAVHWILRPPAGLIIGSVSVPHMYSHGIDNGSGWTGRLFWGGGSVRTFQGQSGWSSINSGGPGFRWPTAGTRYFGWRLACRERRCPEGGNQWLSLEFVEIHLRETRKPYLTAPDGLWQAKGWVRGWWTLHFYGDSPTGLCATESGLGTQAGPGSISVRNSAVWHQCAAPAVDQPVDTAQAGQGTLPLTIRAIDASGQSVTYTRTIEVDNQAPTVSVVGPRDASATAGTQYVKASATAGPSGVAGIACSVDRSPVHWYPTADASVPVAGVGVHHITCYSQSNARDSSGLRASSAPATWTMSIRSTSVSTVSFVRIANALRCVDRRERVRIPGHWTTAYHHRHRVRVWAPSQTRRVRVVHCHPRVVHRRVRRRGHWATKRIVLLPHKVAVSRLRVPFGKGATVKGWLGTSDGNALAGRTVKVLTAPDNGANHFTQAAVVRTSRNGVWTAHLGAGPSRLVVAQFAGGDKVQPSVSTPAHLVVPQAYSSGSSRTTLGGAGPSRSAVACVAATSHRRAKSSFSGWGGDTARPRWAISTPAETDISARRIPSTAGGARRLTRFGQRR